MGLEDGRGRWGQEKMEDGVKGVEKMGSKEWRRWGQRSGEDGVKGVVGTDGRWKMGSKE
jgi:hypothetical protein